MVPAQFPFAVLKGPSPTSTLWMTEFRTTIVFQATVPPTARTQPISTSRILTGPLPSLSFTTPPKSTTPPSVLPISLLRPIATKVLTVSSTSTKIVHPAFSISISPSMASTSVTGTTWSAPAQMTDLSAFNVSSFHTGRDNLAIVQGIPEAASATANTLSSARFTVLNSLWDNTSSIIQLFYPAHSINPGNSPVGGAQFYASPLAAKAITAHNATLSYSVFFPADFDFVLGGKLPGLYGGHTGCSGGADAQDCFSTRLMWRKDGEGELYLYAPKDKQASSLCKHAQSSCSSVYGLSIGRGSFRFARGAWTRVTQTVVLNNAGKRDGMFMLDVNGQRVIERHDVFYRDVSKGGEKGKKKPKKTPKKPLDDDDDDDDGDDNGRLGDILNPLLHGVVGRDMVWDRDLAWSQGGEGGREFDWYDFGGPDWHGYRRGGHGGLDHSNRPRALGDEFLGSFYFDKADSRKGMWTVEVKANNDATQRPQKPVGFLGLFFSTFFGGHDPEYATPRDQYVWFKDFTISYSK